MRAASVAGLVLASLTKLATAEDLLFYNDMLYKEYSEATTTLGYTAHIASDAEWRSYTTADFAKYKAIIVPDPNCGTIDKIKFLDDTKAVWSPAVTGNMILIGTDPTYHSASRSGAIDLIDDSIRFAASGSKGTGLYFSLSCYYDSGDITTIDSLSEFGTFYVRGKLACYNDAHLVADAPELKALDDSSIGNWSCSVHEVFTEFPKMGMEPGTDGFESFAIARNATGDGEESYADGSAGIPYIIARGATPVGCGDGKIEASFGEECDNGPDANGAPGNPCSTSCKCLFGVLSPGVCKLSNTTSSSSSMSSSSTVISNSRSVPTDTGDECTTDTVSSTALPSTSANSTLPSSTPTETTSLPASSTGEPTSATPGSSTTPDGITVTAEPSGSSLASPGLPSSPAVPANSSDPTAGPRPPVTVTASAKTSNSSAPSTSPVVPSAPGTPPSGPLPPITIVTTIDGPTPSVITVIATANPPLSAESGSGPLPPITIITTIDGPVPSVITIIAEPPPTTNPMPSTSLTTIGAPGAGPSSSPENPGSTTIITVGGPGAGGPPSSPGPIIPPLPTAGPGSASPSFVTVVVSAGGGNSNPGNSPATSVTAGSPSNPGSGASVSDNSPLSTETSIRTVISTAAPNGGSPSNPGSGSPSSAAASAPAGASSGAPSAPGVPTSAATSVQTIVNTVSAPGSGLPSGPGNSATSGAPTAGSPATGSLANPVPPGSAPTAGSPATGSLANPVPPGSATTGGLSASGTASSAEASFLSALHSGSPSSATSGAPAASGSESPISAAPTSTVLSGSLLTPISGALTSALSSGTGAPGVSVTSASATLPTNGTASALPNSGGSGASASGSGASNPVGSSTALSSSDGGFLTAVTAPTSLPGNPHATVSDSAAISASAIVSSVASGDPVTPSDGPGISKNGTIFTASSKGASGTALPTTLATTTLPTGPDSTCDLYIGIEVIEFIEITEICPEGATTCLSTMTRPICHTSTPGYPCYPCMGLTPSAGDTATVTRSSCTTSTPLTTTITAQTCHTCQAVTYTTTSIPGYTPGGGCKDCQPYTTGALTLPPATVTIDATATATVRISKPECHDCPDAAPTEYPNASGPIPGLPSNTLVGSGGSSGPAPTTVLPGNPGLPNTSGVGGGYGGPAPTTASTPATVPKPSTVPSYVTAAGGPRSVIWDLGAGVAAAAVWALMMM
ncbi:hypothetical protein CONLIGDRAFT_706721 [Coniochaeta ligniaria NRRL 30616]|uniref:Uncharacterized protein n=1 Tax=Coniochaeta ligniaria NRRL 30616 TaxID=1408157 RepID=A0A1J7IG51_9PEZI|nr:hypothetical protein CONLIGDRAFT_706721 [Coniochaeta ligniaria NRRL 30616]